jgi:recombination protein RecA
VISEAMEEVLSQIDPKLRKKVSVASDIEVIMQKTPSVGLNKQLNGGLAYGRQVLIWGNKSAGKSSFCLQMIGQAQKEGKICAWIDSEQSYDPKWAQRLGVDSESLIYSPARTINDMVDARDMTNAVKMLNYANNQTKQTLLVLISQQRNNIGQMFVSHQPTGGHAVKFFSSTVVKLWSSESEKNAIQGKIEVGDKVIQSKIGRQVTWTIDYNKTGKAFESGMYDFYFSGDFVGVDNIAEVVDVAEQLGHIEKGGAWYTVLGERFQGRAKVVEWLRQNPDKAAKLVQIIE